MVNCVGLRAEESAKRKKMVPFKFDKGNSKAGREWHEWLTVHAMDEATVYATIAAAGQQPHIVYLMGMKRYSCVFCIYADDASLKRAAELVHDRPELVNDPDVYRNYVGLERSTGQVMMMPNKTYGRRDLDQITGISPGT